jgi:hypothetical protein
MAKKPNIWKDRPEKHDYPAAHDYLTLLFEEKAARKLVAALRRAPSIERKAKDLLRASGLPLLDKANPHVASETRKIKDAKALSPVLLVRGNARAGLPLVVADGYHRICASWYRGEDLDIVCRIVHRPAS